MHKSPRVMMANKVTWVGLFVNIVLTLFKLVSGISGNSAAMIADAFHSLSDFATDIVVLLGFQIVDRPVDKTHDYGHGKVETLTSGIIGAVLLAVGLKILWMGACRIYGVWQGHVIVRPGWIALCAAVISIAAKECLYRYTVKTGKEINSPAVIANAWHHRSDALSSVATMLGIGGAILLGEKWRVLDPIAAVAVSFFIVKAAVVILSGSFNELTEASLSDDVEDEILEIIRAIPGVKYPHNIRTRRIGNYIAVDVHIKVANDLNIVEAHNISTKVENAVKKSFGGETFMSVHVEPLGSENPG